MDFVPFWLVTLGTTVTFHLMFLSIYTLNETFLKRVDLYVSYFSNPENHDPLSSLTTPSTVPFVWKTLRTVGRELCNRLVQNKNKYSLATEKAKDSFVRHKAERLAPPATGSRSSLSFTKATSHNFRTSNFPFIHNSSGFQICGLLDKAEDYASQFASSSISLSPTYSFSSISSHVFLPGTTARKISQVLYNMNVSKPSGSDGIPASILKMCSTAVPYNTPSISFLS